MKDYKERITCQKHKRHIERYDGDMQQLVNDIGDLHYEALESFFDLLTEKIKEDSWKDKQAGRELLGKGLYELALSISKSAQITERIYEICAPHMGEERRFKLDE